MSVTITAFRTSPDGGKGLARDMPVRWALEETGTPYETRLVTFAQMRAPDHLAHQPFGQIPVFQDGALSLFESSAIVLHIAGRFAGLLPDDPDARSRAVTWMFAAQTTIEPPVVEREMAFLTEQAQPWFEDRLPLLEARLDRRLSQLSARLGGDWLDGAFSAGDLVMVCVLRRLEERLDDHPKLRAYVSRGAARPAFQRAFAAQKAVFDAQ